jgi:predicted CoA-substrate-specific enzyme activase
LTETIAAVGVDLGSAAVKVVGVDASGAIAVSRVEPTEPRYEQQATALLAELGVEGLPVVATGYGRKLLTVADRAVTEITCHARGFHRQVGGAGTVIDIGGQDSKVIAVDAAGQVQNFTMNDKCAAGTGRFLEVTAARLRVSIDELGGAALRAEREVAISNTCTVFAESEIVSLIARGEEVGDIVRGLHRAMVKRVVSLVRSVKPKPPLYLAGGVARNDAVRAFLSEALRLPVSLPDHPQLLGAHGAALLSLSA